MLMFNLFELRRSTAAALLGVSVALCGCGRDPEKQQQANASAADASVELSADQVRAIKVAPVSTYAFRVQRDEAGTVSQSTDPALAQAEATLISAAATFRTASQELQRVGSLGQANGISQKEIEQAKSDQQAAAGALRAARVALRSLGEPEPEIERMIRDGGLPPTAPTQVKWITAYALEADTPYVAPGQAMTASLDALPGETFRGWVHDVYAAVDPNTHRVTVRCEVSDPANKLRPGMLADVVIQTAAPVDAVALPANGIVREGDGTTTAWVTSDRHRFVQRVVRTGLRENGLVQIVAGLRPGELAVTDGAVFLDNMVNAAPDD